MGRLLKHSCDACGYSTTVGGGCQLGMTSVQWTIYCHDCAELQDAVVSEEPWNTPPGWVPDDYPCPVNDAHRAEPWSAASGCPKCGGSITLNDDEIVLWD